MEKLLVSLGQMRDDKGDNGDNDMRITKYGHACLLVEEEGVRILIDPGAWSAGFEGLVDLDAILITHQHQDHLVPEHVRVLMKANPGAAVYADEGSTVILSETDIEAVAVHGGDELVVAGVSLRATGRDHAVIHNDIAGIPNVGYVIGGQFYYPGDSFTLPGQAVEILAIPAAAPWMSVAGAIDFVRAVKPRVAIPVHDAVLSEVGVGVYHGVLGRMIKDAGVELVVLERGEAREF